MRKLLYRNRKHQEVGKQIKNLWDLRKKSIEEINKVTPIGKGVTGQNINPLLGGQVSRTSKNPSPGGLVSRTGINPPQDGRVTGPRKIHHRVAMAQDIGRSTV